MGTLMRTGVVTGSGARQASFRRASFNDLLEGRYVSLAEDIERSGRG